MNELAIAISVILFPGLICASLTDNLIVHAEKWQLSRFIINSFFFGMLCYATLQVLCANKALSSWDIIHGRTHNIDLSEVFFASLLSIPIASVIALSVNRKWINKIARKLKISNKYGDENLFTFYLNTDDIDWIYIRDIENDITYQGRIFCFSETNDCQEIVLTNVTVYRYEDSAELYSIPSIYISNSDKNFIIEETPRELIGEQ